MANPDSTDSSSVESASTSISSEAEATSSHATVFTLYRNRTSASDKISTAKVVETNSSQATTAASTSQVMEGSSALPGNDSPVSVASISNPTTATTSTTPPETHQMTKRSHSEDMQMHKRRIITHPGTRRLMRSVYRTTGVTSHGDDFTVHKEPAIPLLNYRGNKNTRYEAITDSKQVSRASFITLRISKEKARSAFQGLEGMEPTTANDPQKNRPFVTLKYKKT